MRTFHTFQSERWLIGELTKAALAVKKAQGVTLGRPRTTLPTEVIERIQSARAAGASWSAIARELNADAVPTAQGGPCLLSLQVMRDFLGDLDSRCFSPCV